jgi:predicted nuclease of predicted toxin-antitoxin system
MKILANENFPKASVEYLQSNGYDIKSIGTDNAGISDGEVMMIAISENRLIVTFDSDYGELIFKHGYKPPAGVIYIRIMEYSPDYPGQLIHHILSTTKLDFSRKISVIDQNGIRQRSF